ncbi:MAG TPA: MAPEG family protein [Azospirillaceae bacterium]|nr:MAPEG family protein [Azospirillaceae bacterium]
MTAIAITPVYAGLLGLLLLALAAQVVRVRIRTRVPLGDGGKPELLQAMRAQANFIEYVPLILVLVALVEATGHPAWTVHALGGGLFAGRLLHAWGLNLSPGRTPGRAIGILLTWAALLAASLILIIDHLR